MKLLLLSLAYLSVFSCWSQAPYATIASNRIVQVYHNPARLAKIAQLDENRVQAVWNYLSGSFSFTSEDNLSLEELMNFKHFDVYQFENLRAESAPVSITFKDNIYITLKSRQETQSLLLGYDLTELLFKIPVSPFPLWSTTTFSDVDFREYKEKVWKWAKDYPQEYLVYTSNPDILHIHFTDWKYLSPERRNPLLESGNYLIVD